MTPAEFFAEALPWAEKAHAATGVLPSVILAQWADETGFGGVDWSPNNNPGNVGSYDGQPVASFPSLEAGVAAYIETMKLGYYQAVRTAPTWRAQCYALGESPWASGRYCAAGGVPGADLIEIVSSHGLTSYDAPPAPQGGNMLARDEKTGGYWVTDETGAVFAYAGAPYLGGLNIHPAWNAGAGNGDASMGPCVGIAGDGVGGYVLACHAGGHAPAIYHFTSDGAYATAT